jgi:hypothetical protein
MGADAGLLASARRGPSWLEEESLEVIMLRR